MRRPGSVNDVQLLPGRADRAVLGPALALGAEDAQLVPVLRGREGEALCKPWRGQS
jgi:hypothetical protein